MTPEAVFALVQDRPGAAWLDGAGDGWSVLAWDPMEVVTDGARWPEVGRRLTRSDRSGEAPFTGGCLGYIGYGAGHRTAPVPAAAPTDEPEVWLGRYEGGLCFRHADATWHIGGTDAFCAAARALLDEARSLPPPPAPTAASIRTVDRSDYEQGVRDVLELVAAGDCYQVNLTRPVHVDPVPDPWQAYRRLRTAPAAFGAFLRLSDALCILSNSPELFIEVRGDQVASVPIKGTRPIGREDELTTSEKDRAELTMIVDLVRNDLGRVARTGTVRTHPRVITAHPTVLHASQRVEAQLPPDLDAWHALAAAFPPGSVTGAPKVRACTRIAQLEPSPRGVYCGAIGYTADGGDASWSVAIRTAVWSSGRVRYHVGGGIVSASDPTDEWWETVHKGRALARAFAGVEEA